MEENCDGEELSSLAVNKDEIALYCTSDRMAYKSTGSNCRVDTDAVSQAEMNLLKQKCIEDSRQGESVRPTSSANSSRSSTLE